VSLPQSLKQHVHTDLCDLIKEAEEGIRAGRVTDGQQAMRRLREELVPRP